MSKFGWSLPPGCSTLPGESREEQEAEALIDSLYEAISPMRPHYAEHVDPEEIEDAIVDALEKIVNEAYQKGRAEGLYEGQQAGLAMAKAAVDDCRGA